MAKRLTDTAKWASRTFRALPSKMKVLYLYLVDTCDAAGVVNLDLDLIGYTLGEKFTLDEVRECFPQKLIFLSEEKVAIRNYIAFQNGDILDSTSKIASSIRNTLNSHGLLEMYKRGELGAQNGAISLY